MAEVVREHLQLVRREAAVVPENLVVAGATRTLNDANECKITKKCKTGGWSHLNTLVTQEVEISFRGMVDALVHDSPSQRVAVSVLVIVRREKST